MPAGILRDSLEHLFSFRDKPFTLNDALTAHRETWEKHLNDLPLPMVKQFVSNTLHTGARVFYNPSGKLDSD